MARIPIVNPRNPEKFVLYKIIELRKSQKAPILQSSISGVSASSGNAQAIADGTYVDSLAASGQTGMTGDITLSGGTGITLTQVTSPSNNIDIALDSAINSLNAFYNGSVYETISLTISSNGVTITASLEASGGGDLTCRFGNSSYTLDCTPAATVNLTAGTDTVPVRNYIYITESGGTLTLTANTTGFPHGTTPFCAIGEVVVQSAATVQTDGCLSQQNTTDHITESNEQGHLEHINDKLRALGPTWVSGVTPTLSSGATSRFSSTAGVVYQLHRQSVPAFNMATGTDCYIVNDNTTPYTTTTELVGSIANDSTGTALGRYFTLVFWATASKSGTGNSKLFVNLPSGSYNSQAQAIADNSKYTNYSIPSAFKQTGFLIAAYTIDEVGGSWSIEQTVDLRGQVPSITAGAGLPASSEFDDDVFAVHDNGDETKRMQFQCSGITTATTRTYTAPNKDGTLALLSDVTGDVTASANITDHAIVRGDGGAKGVQDSGILINDSDAMSATAGTIDFQSATAITIRGRSSTGAGVQGEYTGASNGVGVVGTTDSSNNDSYGGSFDHMEIADYYDVANVSAPANPNSGDIRHYANSSRPYALTNSGNTHDLSRTVRGWHIAEGEIGTQDMFNCSKADQDTSNAAFAGTITWFTRGSTNFSTGAVESYLQLTWAFRRMSNELFWSKDVLVFAPFVKDGKKASATILMREGSSHTATTAVDSISFHITDGTTVSTASGTQFSALGSSWGKFTTGEIDVSGYGDDLYWVLKINGNDTVIGSDANETVQYDIHSVLVEQWAE